MFDAFPDFFDFIEYLYQKLLSVSLSVVHIVTQGINNVEKNSGCGKAGHQYSFRGSGHKAFYENRNVRNRADDKS